VLDQHELSSVAGWRAPILRHFTPAIAASGHMTVVLDEDALFTDPALLEAVSFAGFELLPADDPVALRYAFETRVRARRAGGARAPHAIVPVRRRPVELAVPWDLLRIARLEERELAFGVAELFPRLAPSVVAELPREMLDSLAAALSTHHLAEQLGEQGSRDFILRHVYKVAPELVQRDVDLLRVLLRRHHLGEAWPPGLDARFVGAVRAGGRFADWPLERIVPERDSFFLFLEERWPRFVRRNAASGAVPEQDDDMRLPGPADIPFGHEDVRVYVDTLFLEGRLARTRTVPASAVQGSWIAVGVQADEDNGNDVDARLERLGKLLADEMPSAEASHLAWGTAARRYSEWLAALRSAPKAVYGARSGASWRNALESTFSSWMLKRYAGMASLPSFPRPVMVHQVPEVMARELRGKTRRVALVVMDGMAGSQWSSIRASMQFGEAAVRVDEDVAFAWVPTITSVSRQALLAGEPPLYFGQTLDTTGKDETRWRAFWGRESLSGQAVAHVGQRDGEGDDAFVIRALESAGRPGMRAVAITCTAVDRMVHGVVGGDRGLQAQVAHWTGEGHVSELILGLLRAGYVVHVTADHGNVPAIGVGRPKVGDTPELRGERVIVFAHDALRIGAAGAIPGSVLWPQVGLPNDYFALLAPTGGAFTTLGAEIMGHGGISIEEVIVPYVRYEAAP
jgi:PglZ domain